MTVSLSLDSIPSDSDSVQLLLAVVDRAFMDLVRALHCADARRLNLRTNALLPRFYHRSLPSPKLPLEFTGTARAGAGTDGWVGQMRDGLQTAAGQGFCSLSPES